MTQTEFTQFTGKAMEAFSLFAEINQRVVQELADLAATTAKDGARLYGELQANLVQAAREQQAALLDGPAGWPETQKDPFQWYQKGITAVVEGSQRAFRLFEADAQALTRLAERLEGNTTRTAKEIQEAMAAYATRLKELHPQG